MNHTFTHNETQSDALYGGFDKMQVELQRIIKL